MSTYKDLDTAPESTVGYIMHYIFFINNVLISIPRHTEFGHKHGYL